MLIKLPIITSLHMLQNIIKQYQCLSEDMNYVIWKCQKEKLPDFELEELKFNKKLLNPDISYKNILGYLRFSGHINLYGWSPVSGLLFRP